MNKHDLPKMKHDREERHRAAEADVKYKALITIEGLTLAVGSEDKILSACYRFAHVGLGHCDNPHDDWRKELDETYQNMVESGVI